MYQGHVLGGATTVVGVAALPNTGGNEVLLVASIATTVVGLAIVLSTIGRQLAKKAFTA